MKLSKTDLIELKVLGKLPKSYDREFDLLLDTDSSFVKQFAIVQGFSAYISNEKVLNFRENLDNIQANFEKTKQTRIIQLTQAWKYVASIAAVFLIAFGSYVFINDYFASDRLFEKYYQLDDVYLNTRSGNSANADVLEKGLILFEKDKYKESINYFDQIPNSITAIYYSGVAHMELGDYEVAVYKFDLVIDDYLNVFYDQANWYKALGLIKLTKNKEAIIILHDISKTDSYYKTQAKELLKELK